MDKIAIQSHATDPYNRASIYKAFSLIEMAMNRAADGYLFPITAVTASYTMTLNDSIVLVNATAGAITITLPLANECTQKRISIKKTDASANVVTIDGNGAETIDGTATKTLATQYKSYELVASGGAWWIVSAI
jgi:hypothetical protein